MNYINILKKTFFSSLLVATFCCNSLNIKNVSKNKEYDVDNSNHKNIENLKIHVQQLSKEYGRDENNIKKDIKKTYEHINNKTGIQRNKLDFIPTNKQKKKERKFTIIERKKENKNNNTQNDKNKLGYEFEIDEKDDIDPTINNLPSLNLISEYCFDEFNWSTDVSKSVFRKINKKDFFIDKKSTKGTTEVYFCRYDGKEYVVKKISKKEYMRAKKASEQGLGPKIKNINFIIKYDYVYILMEKLESIQSIDNIKLFSHTNFNSKNLIYQFFKKLNKFNFQHCDIKPDNLMLKKRGNGEYEPMFVDLAPQCFTNAYSEKYCSSLASSIILLARSILEVRFLHHIKNKCKNFFSIAPILANSMLFIKYLDKDYFEDCIKTHLDIFKIFLDRGEHNKYLSFEPYFYNITKLETINLSNIDEINIISDDLILTKFLERDLRTLRVYKHTVNENFKSKHLTLAKMNVKKSEKILALLKKNSSKLQTPLIYSIKNLFNIKEVSKFDKLLIEVAFSKQKKIDPKDFLNNLRSSIKNKL